LRLGSLNGGKVREAKGGFGRGDKFAGRTRDGVFDGVKGVEAGEDVDLAEHSPAFAGVGYDGFDGDDVVIVERGEDGDDGAFNVVDGVIVGVANVDGVGVVGVVGLTKEEDEGMTADGGPIVLYADDLLKYECC